MVATFFPGPLEHLRDCVRDLPTSDDLGIPWDAEPFEAIRERRRIEAERQLIPVAREIIAYAPDDIPLPVHFFKGGNNSDRRQQARHVAIERRGQARRRDDRVCTHGRECVETHARAVPLEVGNAAANLSEGA